MTASVRKIWKRAKALLSRPDARRVFYLNFAVTYSCNSACRMCNIWRKYRDDPGRKNDELSLPEIRELFTSPHLRELRNIHLTGGEPFLRPDFVDLAGFFIRTYPAATVFIATNSLSPGLVVDRLGDIFRRYSPDPGMIHLGFSVDGIGKTHDEQRGRANAYERVVEGVETVRARFPKVDVNVNFTITPENAGELMEVFALSKRLGARFGTQFAQLSESFYGNAEVTCTLTPERLRELQGQLDMIRRGKQEHLKLFNKLGDVEGLYLSRLVEYQRDRKRLFRCYSGTHSLFLDPYGSVFPCIMLSRSLGNVKEQRFSELWFSREAAAVREEIRSEKCSCWTGCEVIPSLQRDAGVLLRHQAHLAKGVLSRRPRLTTEGP